MSRFVEIECAGTVTIELDDDGELHFHDFDEEAELAAVAMGFEPSLCLLLRDFIIKRDLHIRFDPSKTLLVMLEGAPSPRADDRGDLLAPAYLGDVVAALLALGANPNYKNHYCEYLLTLAAMNCLFEAIPSLLDAGADPTSNKNGALRWSAEYGQDEIINLLLDHGSDINAMAGAALFRAAEQNNSSTVQLLLEKGIALSDGAAERAALAAIREGNITSLRLLLEAGADPHWSKGILFTTAREEGSRTIIKLLEEYA